MQLKIADFGLGRWIGDPVQSYSHEMVTLWYRCPELLLQANQYGPEVDMWSVGCIIAEMSGKLLFPGRDPSEQLTRIFQTLGTPSPAVWPEMQLYPGRDELAKLGQIKRKKRLDQLIPLSLAGINLIRGCLTFKPSARTTASQALSNKIFL
jgi:serine/threonine protein kinase